MRGVKVRLARHLRPPGLFAKDPAWNVEGPISGSDNTDGAILYWGYTPPDPSTDVLARREQLLLDLCVDAKTGVARYRLACWHNGLALWQGECTTDLKALYAHFIALKLVGRWDKENL